MQTDINNIVPQGTYKVATRENFPGKVMFSDESIILTPENDSNKQTRLYSDNNKHEIRISTRHRKDEKHPWSEWELKYTISNR